MPPRHPYRSLLTGLPDRLAQSQPGVYARVPSTRPVRPPRVAVGSSGSGDAGTPTTPTDVAYTLVPQSWEDGYPLTSWSGSGTNLDPPTAVGGGNLSTADDSSYVRLSPANDSGTNYASMLWVRLTATPSLGSLIYQRMQFVMRYRVSNASAAMLANGWVGANLVPDKAFGYTSIGSDYWFAIIDPSLRYADTWQDTYGTLTASEDMTTPVNADFEGGNIYLSLWAKPPGGETVDIAYIGITAVFRP
jgi:hypothetical protein